MQKLAMHAGGCAHDGGEKKNVLIVSVSLPIAVNFTLRSKTQRRIEVLGMRLQTFLLHVATAPKTVMEIGADLNGGRLSVVCISCWT